MRARQRLADRLYEQLANHFGGTTATEAAAGDLAGWIMGPGRVITERALANLDTSVDATGRTDVLMIRQITSDIADLARMQADICARDPYLRPNIQALSDIANRWAS